MSIAGNWFIDTIWCIRCTFVQIQLVWYVTVTMQHRLKAHKHDIHMTHQRDHFGWTGKYRKSVCCILQHTLSVVLEYVCCKIHEGEYRANMYRAKYNCTGLPMKSNRWLNYSWLMVDVWLWMNYFLWSWPPLFHEGFYKLWKSLRSVLFAKIISIQINQWKLIIFLEYSTQFILFICTRKVFKLSNT